MRKSRIIIWLLIAYGVIQFLSLYIHHLSMFIAYEALYLLALIIGVYHVVEKKSQYWKETRKVFSYFFIANAVLMLLYIPLLIFNSSINWSLNEGYAKGESDPLIMMIFWPPIHIVISLIILSVLALINKIRLT